MTAEYRDPFELSTPMIKGELVDLLRELAPDKRWPKSSRLRDYIAFTVQRFAADTTEPRERRALALARTIYDSERR